MIAGITKDKHWFTDYTYIPLVFAAPKMVGFEKEKEATNFCYTLSFIVLTYSLVTNAKWGVVKLIPYQMHVTLDFTLGVAALAAPALVKVSDKKARNTLFLMGITGIVVGTLSFISANKS